MATVVEQMRGKRTLTSLFVACFLPALAFLFFASCTQSTSPTSAASTVSFSPDGKGFIQYETNDAANYGYEYWEYYTATSNPKSTVVTATAIKNSGSANYGYGVIFGHRDDKNFYRVKISENGEYDVYKIVNGKWAQIRPWSSSPNVKTGYGVANVIQVTYSTNLYSVYINDLTTPVCTFLPDNVIGTLGSAGFIAAIGTSSAESFPGTPVDVRFKMTAPIAVP